MWFFIHIYDLNREESTRDVGIDTRHLFPLNTKTLKYTS